MKLLLFAVLCFPFIPPVDRSAQAAAKAAAAKETPALTLTLAQHALAPGEVVLAKIRSPHALRAMDVHAFDRRFPAFSTEDATSWTALIGIDLNTIPGSHPVTLLGTGHDGETLTTRDILRIAPKEFPTRHLKVEQKYVTPPQSELSRIRKESAAVEAIFNECTDMRYWSGPFRSPVPGAVISVFGKRTVYNNKPRKPHTGVDFRGAVGTPILAPNAGRVVLAEDLYYSGLTVIIDHGLGLYSYLAHMSGMEVGVGERVQKGQIVGKVGATGRVTGPHLHWTLCISGARVDPMSLIRALK